MQTRQLYLSNAFPERSNSQVVLLLSVTSIFGPIVSAANFVPTPLLFGGGWEAIASTSLLHCRRQAKLRKHEI